MMTRETSSGLSVRGALVASLLGIGAMAVPASAGAQERDDNPPPLFASRDLVTLRITTDLHTLVRDKVDDAPWREAAIAFPGPDGTTISRPVRIRTRGLWRLRHCTFPPLRLNFVKDSVKETLFARQDRPKIATHCRNSDTYVQYLLQEYLLYRVQETLMPQGLQARLARITWVDTTGRADSLTNYAVILEDPDAMAERLGGRRIETKGIAQERLDAPSAVRLGLFQYMIGNTDWSVPGLHNIEIVERQPEWYYAVAYDFDWSGAVNARYAEPDPSLGTRSVRQRLWRGVCPDTGSLRTTIEHFQAQRPRIEALFDSVPGLEADRARSMREYFDEFWQIIGEDRRIRRELGRVCLNYQDQDGN